MPTPNQPQAHGITFPLITSSSGEKLGKSAGNAIWLNSTLTTPYHFYQYFIQTHDDDVKRFLHLFTFLPLSEIDDVLTKHDARKEKRLAQATLAREVGTAQWTSSSFSYSLLHNSSNRRNRIFISASVRLRNTRRISIKCARAWNAH